MLVAAFFLSMNMGVDHTVQAIIKASPGIFLCYIILKSQVWKNSLGIKVQMTSCEFMNNMAVGLVFCALGDFLLHMEDHPKYSSDFWFLAGLVSFLIGHIFFMFSLSKRSYALKEKSGTTQDDMIQKLVITLIIFVMISIIVPVIKEPLLKIGVCCYAFVIGRMALWSLILSSQEARLAEKMQHELSNLSKTDQEGEKGQYLNTVI